jgi:hypothetical protein
VRFVGTLKANFSSTIPKIKINPTKGSADKSKASRFPKKEKHNDVTAEENNKQIYLRANAKGKLEYTEKIINGVPCKVVTVGGKSYIPNITQ